jgi:hypothetical protein
MERTLFNRNGDAVAYLTDDYHRTIYVLDGHPVAYLYEDRHIYGINGHHLGWFVNDIIFNHLGERIGFTGSTCPVAVAKEPVKAEKYKKDEIKPRWQAPPFPNLTFDYAARDFGAFLKDGQVLSRQA